MNKKNIDGYISEIKTADVVARYVAGESAYSIAKAYGVSAGTVIYRLKQSNVYKSKEAKTRYEHKQRNGSCHEAYTKLVASIENEEEGSTLEFAEFVVATCKGCPFMKEKCTYKEKAGGIKK